MAEKNFKLGTNLELSGASGIRFDDGTGSGTFLLNYDIMSQKLQSNSWNIALESYVDDAIANSTVNVDALAGYALTSSNGQLSVDVGPIFVGVVTYGLGLTWDGTYLGVNTDSIATRDFVGQELANLVNAAPSWLDTLDELSAALGDDENFATTVTNSIAGKIGNDQVGNGLSWNGSFIEANTDVLALKDFTIGTDEVGYGLSWNGSFIEINTDALAGTGLVSGGGLLAIDTFGPRVQNDSTDEAYVTTVVGHGSPQYNSYAIIATIPSTASSFEAYVSLIDPMTGKSRTSKIVATTDKYSQVEYTEFAIVEVGQGSIPNADVLVEWQQGSGYQIKVSGNGGEGQTEAVAEVKYITLS